MSLRIEIVDRRLTGGRLSILARTKNRTVRRKREAAVRMLLDAGLNSVIDRLRDRSDPLRIEDIERAVKAGGLEDLRGAAGEPLRLGEVCRRALNTVSATVEEGTAKEYRTVARKLKKHFGASKDIATLTKDEAQAFLHAPHMKGGRTWSAGRQQQVRILAGRIWRDAIEREREHAELANRVPRVERNPWREAEVRGKRKARASYLQPAEWAAVAAKVAGTPRAAFLALGALAGLRMMEAAHLRTDLDVDMDAAELHVQPRGGDVAWRPKTDRSVRTVPLSEALYRTLAAHIEAGFAGARYLIRLPDKDAPLSPSTGQKWTRQSFRAAGLVYGRKGDGVTYHSLRHSFASWLVQAGVSPLVVAALLGDTLKMVEQVYGHLAPRNYREAVETLDRVTR